MGELVRLNIPDEVNVIAVPTKWLETFYSEKEGKTIEVIKKSMPEYERGCGAAHYYVIKVVMLPRGGILIDKEKERKGKYHVIHTDGSVEGWLVFEKDVNSCKSENDSTICEWKLSKDKEPEAFVFQFSDSVSSRVCSASLNVLKTENVLNYVTAETGCAIASEATVAMIVPTDRDAIVEYERERGSYRGPCEKVIEKRRISWNNGNVIFENYEELSNEEIV